VRGAGIPALSPHSCAADSATRLADARCKPVPQPLATKRPSAPPLGRFKVDAGVGLFHGLLGAKLGRFLLCPTTAVSSSGQQQAVQSRCPRTNRVDPAFGSSPTWIRHLDEDRDSAAVRSSQRPCAELPRPAERDPEGSAARAWRPPKRLVYSCSQAP
jgi:hypothetical protein